MRKPLILAHRGFSGNYPENTRVAFMAAIEQGVCDGFESDVHLSSDGEPVIIHDSSLSRTTDGRGAVVEHTFRELRALDCGGYFDARFSGERIMHLEELIALCLAHKVALNLEIKNYEVFYKDIESIVIGCIQKCAASEQVFVSSFNHVSMARCHKVDPSIRTGLLYGYPLVGAENYAKTSVGAVALHPNVRCLRYEENLVQRAHQIGLAVHTWTVNEIDDMQYCIDCGVDSIITNYPDRLHRLLHR